MKGVFVCKTCLITNVKMFHLDILAYAYSALTGLECYDATTEYVCYECAALLLKFQQFRTKCLKANQVISEIVGKYCKVTEDVVNRIDRKLHNLESRIVKFEIKENIFNEIYNESKFNINENKGPDQSIKIEIDDVIEASDIKYEVELYDDKDQGVSYINESIQLKNYIGLDEDPITLLVKQETDDESTKIKKKTGLPRKKLKQENVEERKKNSSTGTINKGDNSLMEEYFTIVNLTPEEAKKEMLLRKESNNYKTNLYKCDLCYRGYGTLQTYQNHMKKHDKENGDNDCDYCHIKFSTRRYLYRHVLKCHTTKFCCILCSYTCFDAGQAKIHLNLHKGKQYPCEECGQVFSMPNSLLTHQRFKHTSEFVCALCGTVFGKERGIKQHINLLHKQETNEQKGPLCEECDVHFATETAWKRHLVLSSKHTVSNGCDVCGETFENEVALKSHTRVHAREYNPMTKTIKKSIDCTICEITLVGKREYLAHMRTDHPEVTPNPEDYDDNINKPYVCEVCGKMFELQKFLTFHQRIHAVERPYSCPECGKGYKSRKELKIHSDKHSSSRYQCHLCEKNFVYRSSLKKHIKKHHGAIRPYKCNMCEKAYASPSELKYHKHSHEKVPGPGPKRIRSKRKKSARKSSVTS